MSINNSTNVQNIAFIERFIEICGTSEPAIIQRLLKISYQAAKNYLGGRLPEPKVLISIAEKTGVSLNWLLTGEGNKYAIKVDTREFQIDVNDVSYQESANRIIEGLKEAGVGDTEEEILASIHFPKSIFQSYANDGYNGQLLYEVIALRTNLSLNWIITGKGEKTIQDVEKNKQRILLEDFEREKLSELIKQEVDRQWRTKFKDNKINDVEFLAEHDLGTVDNSQIEKSEEFDVEKAIEKYPTLEVTLQAWYKFEGREMPEGFGLNFSGWKSLSLEDKIATAKDVKNFADRMNEKIDKGELDD